MKRTIIALLVLIFLSSCSANATAATSESLSKDAPTLSPTTQLPTFTPTSEAKATATPTEVAPLVDEHDLKPNFTESIEQEYDGVEMKIQIITDASLDPSIKKIFLNPNFKNSLGENSKEAISHAVAYMFFKAWWSNGVVKHASPPTDEDYVKFMSDWSTAQKTNDPADWEKVEFEIPNVNNLNDGNGYVTEKITVWPMYSGSAPEGITPVGEFDIALVRGSRVKNITMYDWSGWECGYGTNIDNDKLIIYTHLIIGSGEKAPITAENLARQISTIVSWIKSGSGKMLDQNIIKILANKVATNGYSAAYKIEPPSEEDETYNP